MIRATMRMVAKLTIESVSDTKWGGWCSRDTHQWTAAPKFDVHPSSCGAHGSEQLRRQDDRYRIAAVWAHHPRQVGNRLGALWARFVELCRCFTRGALAVCLHEGRSLSCRGEDRIRDCNQALRTRALQSSIKLRTRKVNQGSYQAWQARN